MRKKALLLFLVLGLFSCNFFKQDTDKLLVTVYGDKLYFSDIQDLISPDLSGEDSLKLVQALCEKWAKEQLLVQKAKINLPLVLQDVQAQVESYEKSLLIYSYQKELLNQKLDTIVNDDEIQSYYEKNKQNFILNNAVVRVNYIKLKKEVPYLWKVQRLFKKEDEESKLSLEDYCYQFADDYYLDDSWLSVDDIFKVLPDSYTSRNLFKGKNIEFADDDYYYFLHVKKYISKGSVSPLEMVSNQIHSIIINKRKIDFLKHVEMDLYQNALAKNYVQYEKN
ncbi:MAG: hypothetical protein ISP71_00685 [Flavobacteriales bacterium]|nr:hypothetical protein [Flavobacteriales bacterium]